MTTLTLPLLAVVLYGVVGSRGFGRALALGGATPIGAALVVGGTAVPTFYAVAFGTVVALGLRLLGNGRRPSAVRSPLPPGMLALLLFVAWSVLVTVVAPVLFQGLPVLVSEGGYNRLTAGVLTTSNVAQIGYLVLAVCVVLFLARSPIAGPELIGLAAGLTTLLSLWRTVYQLTGLPFPVDFFDNSPTYTFIETEIGGGHRYRGVLSEPAGLAVSSLITICYMLPRSAQVQGWRRAGALFVAAAAAFLGVISTSATFVVAVGVVALLAAGTFAYTFLLRGRSVSVIASIVGCLAIIAALWVLPIIAEFAEAAVNEKVTSSSFDQRSGSDSLSYEIFFDTYGLGAGLGASRASSFFPGLLSTTGLVGTLLLAAAVAGLVRQSASVLEYRPVIWSLVALLVAKVISGPDLSDGNGILWMSLGLLSGAAQIARARTAAMSSTRVVARAQAVDGRTVAR